MQFDNPFVDFKMLYFLPWLLYHQHQLQRTEEEAV